MTTTISIDRTIIRTPNTRRETPLVEVNGETNVTDDPAPFAMGGGVGVGAIDGTGVGTLGITDKLGRFIPAQRRAEMIARTELIRAHHLATIQEYRNWGVLGIKVKGEWKTAGDSRVCERCAELEGKIFTLDEIEPMIPFHPLCRCLALPYIEK